MTGHKVCKRCPNVQDIQELLPSLLAFIKDDFYFFIFSWMYVFLYVCIWSFSDVLFSKHGQHAVSVFNVIECSRLMLFRVRLSLLLELPLFFIFFTYWWIFVFSPSMFRTDLCNTRTHPPKHIGNSHIDIRARSLINLLSFQISYFFKFKDEKIEIMLAWNKDETL